MKRVGIYIFSFLMMIPSCVFGLHLQPVKIDTIKDEVLPSAQKIRFFVGEDTVNKQKVLAALQIEYNGLLEREKKNLEDIQNRVKILKKEIEQVKQQLVKKVKVDFFTKRLSLLNKQYQTLLDIRDIKQQILEVIKQHISYLQKYFKNGFSADTRIDKKYVYTFAELQTLTRKIMSEQEELSRIQEKKEREEVDVSSNEDIVTAREKNVKNIELEIAAVKPEVEGSKDTLLLLDLERETVSKERELALFRVEAHTRKIEFLDSQMFVANKKLELLNNDLVTVRNNVRVDKADVQHYQLLSDKIKKEVQAKKSEFIKKQTDLTTQKNVVQEELATLSKRYKISLANIRQVEEWEFEFDTINENFAAYSVSFAESRIILFDRKIEEVRVDLLLLDAQTAQAQVLADAVRSLYGITQAQFRDNEQLDKERAHYKDLQSSLQTMVKTYKDRVTAAHNFIKAQHKALNNIKKHQERLKAYSQRVIAANQRKYNEAVSILTKSLKKVEEQNDVSLRLSEKYTSLIEMKDETVVTVKFILHELDLIGVWHRSTRAVTWDGVKKIIPNLVVFMQNLRLVIGDYLYQFSIKNMMHEITNSSASSIFTFLLLLLLMSIVYVVLGSTLPILQHMFASVTSEHQSWFMLSKFLEIVCKFLHQHIKPLSGWALGFFLVVWYDLPIALTLIFYAFSIAFLIIMSRSFLRYLLQYNEAENYILLGKHFQGRFAWIFSFFSISTTTILFFRKMFMLVMIYQQSEFPTILLRLYHVVIFVSIVFSIEKEELLNLLPRQYAIFDKFAELIDSYYYLISIGVIGLLIMSDPYLGGYGSLVWYALWNILITILIMTIMYFIHNFIKHYSSWMFFIEDSDFGSNKERFHYAKTWYAVFVVALFLAFVGFTGILTALVWGYKFVDGQFVRLLEYPVFGIDRGGGELEFLRIAGLLRIIFMSGFGILIAYLFRKYVLQKIFDIQYVDPGVQDTVVTISRYVIIAVVILAAFAREGLGFLVTYVLGIGLLTFGWSFKDLFTDVVAYFFILVQRPIKVGDYIKLDDRTMGIVRKISPRAVILRRKDSVTIVVPNSKILKTALYNWNYTRSYLAFEDIVFTVPFDSDPVVVKNILYKIIDENPDLLKVPAPIIRLDNFNDKGYQFMVRAFLSAGNTLMQWSIASDVRFALTKALQAEGIRVAEPIMHVKMKQKKFEDKEF